MTDNINETIDELLADQKRLLRPDMAMVVEVVDSLFDDLSLGTATFYKEARGPVIWTWRDARGKLLTVGPADMPESEDHGRPYWQICQPVVQILGNYLTTTGFVLGNDRDSITMSLTTFMLNHLGAFNGLMAVARRSVSGGGARAAATALDEIERVGKSTAQDSIDSLEAELESILAPKINTNREPN